MFLKNIFLGGRNSGKIGHLLKFLKINFLIALQQLRANFRQIQAKLKLTRDHTWNQRSWLANLKNHNF